MVTCVCSLQKQQAILRNLHHCGYHSGDAGCQWQRQRLPHTQPQVYPLQPQYSCQIMRCCWKLSKSFTVKEGYLAEIQLHNSVGVIQGCQIWA